MQSYAKQVQTRPDFSEQFPKYTPDTKIMEHTYRDTRSRPGWKVLSGFGMFFSILGVIVAITSVVGLLVALISFLLKWPMDELTELPIFLGATVCALAVWGLTRLTRQLQEWVIAIHTGGILRGTWLVYHGTTVHLETIDWTQVTEGIRYTDYSGCHIEYLQENGEKETASLYQSELTRPHNRGDEANFRDLVAQIEWQIHGLRGKPFRVEHPPVPDGDTE